jgi:tetratricopeptide (TPR) repeat protein
MRVHDPVRADRDERALGAFGEVLAAADSLRLHGDAAVAAAAFERAFDASRDDRVARLVVEVLTDLGREPALAVRFGEMAVRLDAGSAWNLRALGDARAAAGDLSGAAESLALAVGAWDSGAREPARHSAWTRFALGRALAMLGETGQALRVLGQAAALDDNVLDRCARDPALEALRASGGFDEALEPARRVFE